MISHDPEPRSEECPSCGEITDADTYNGGGFQFECADCGTTWQH